MSWIGYVGAAAFAMAWIPQCLETWRARRCDVNASFLLLNAIGSLSLAAYAALRRDLVFTAINTLTTAGALLNLYMKVQGHGTIKKDIHPIYNENGMIGRNVATSVLSAGRGETKRP